MTETRALGGTGLRVPRLSLGCVTFGREIDGAAAHAVLDRALEAGVSLFDTAEAYGSGEHPSETILGDWIRSRGCRDRVLVQTKVRPPLTRERVLRSIDESLRRLRVDRIDLFLFHAPDPATPVAESLAAVEEAIDAGKVRFAGCSNFEGRMIDEAIGFAEGGGGPRLEVCQSNYNLAVRDAAADVFPTCQRLGVGVQTYSPLGAGFLTGKYREADVRKPEGSRFDFAPGHGKIYFHPDKFEVCRRLQGLSARVGIPVPRLAIAWVLKDQAVDTVLFGARNVAQVDAAVAALSVRFEPAWERELFDRLEAGR